MTHSLPLAYCWPCQTIMIDDGTGLQSKATAVTTASLCCMLLLLSLLLTLFSLPIIWNVSCMFFICFIAKKTLWWFVWVSVTNIDPHILIQATEYGGIGSVPGKRASWRGMSCWSLDIEDCQFNWVLKSSLSSEWISSRALWWMMSDWNKKVLNLFQFKKRMLCYMY